MNAAITMPRPRHSIDAGSLVRSAVQRGILFPGLGAVCEIRSTGLENLSHTGPLIIVGNHESLIDTLVVLRTLPGERRRVTAVTAAADYFFGSKLHGRLTRSIANAIPVERGGGGNGAAGLEACAGHLRSGGSVLMFPEGTRSADGTMARFRRGAARLAIATGTPVIPLGIVGVGDILPKGSRIPRPGAAWVHIGAPITPAENASADELTALLETRVRDLRSEAMREARPRGANSQGFAGFSSSPRAGH